MRGWRSGVIVVAGLAACGSDDRDGGPLETMHTVQVWFVRDEAPVAVQRRVAGAPLDGALRTLVLGPTATERANGISSWFSADTRTVLRRVQAADGGVIVDFRDLPDRIPGAGSSAGSEQLLASLDSTVFQFKWVDSVQYRLEGSCDAFWEWLQRSCEVVRRP
jgi:spore germination protein GerM